MPDVAPDFLSLKPGYKVDERWIVDKKLGQGSFGAVYKVIDEEGEFEGTMALKLESTKAKSQVLKIEVAVLKSMTGLKHACVMFDRGRNSQFNFMVMSILGPALASLRKKAPKAKFTLSTTTRLVFQCLKAVRDMHSVGWIHRDVKPANFAIGGNSELRRRVYLFDFGLARRFQSRVDHGNMRKVRNDVGFRGTPRYCSVNVHAKREQGRHDDLISLLYMLVEFHNGTLPWAGLPDKPAIARSKNTQGTKIFKQLPLTFVPVHTYLHSLTYDSAPKYSMFEEVLLKIIYSMGYNFQALDWESGVAFKPQQILSPEEANSEKVQGKGQSDEEPEKVDDLPLTDDPK